MRHAIEGRHVASVLTAGIGDVDLPLTDAARSRNGCQDGYSWPNDRLDGDELPLTHEFLSIMLGVQRSSVTLALQVVVRDALISTRAASPTTARRWRRTPTALARLFDKQGAGQLAVTFVG